MTRLPDLGRESPLPSCCVPETYKHVMYKSKYMHEFRSTLPRFPFLPISRHPLLHRTTGRDETRPLSIRQQTSAQQDRAAPLPNLPCNRQRRETAGRARNHPRRIGHRKCADFPIHASTAHAAHLRIRPRSRGHPQPPSGHDIFHPWRARGEPKKSRSGAPRSASSSSSSPSVTYEAFFIYFYERRSTASWASAAARRW
jgi:hypothetical protein